MKFTKKDLFFSIITGLIAGIIGYLVFKHLGRDNFFGWSTIYLIVIVPILWILGVNLGYFLGKWIGFFNQFGKFVAIGFTNFLVDLGTLYLLIFYFGLPGGYMYTFFKGVSFIVAMLHSYVWNKYWVFDAGKSSSGTSEFIKFLTVSLSSSLVNVLTATVVFKLIPPLGGMNMEIWAGIGAIAGSAAALLFSFAGFKIAVFGKYK